MPSPLLWRTPITSLKMTSLNALVEKSVEMPLIAKEIISLTSYLEVLQRKKDTVAKLDATILPLIQEATELESLRHS